MPDYAVRWNDDWTEYVEFSRDQDPTHLSRRLVALIVETRLPEHLNSLEGPGGYYARVEQFKDVARSAKAQPGNAKLQNELKDLENELQGKQLLLPYRQSVLAALTSLESIANDVSGRIQLKKPGTIESSVITKLLNQAKSISDDLRRDAEAYVTNTAKTLATIRTTVFPH